MIESAIRAALMASPAVAALVGDRVFVDRIPQSVPYPAITIARVTDIPFQSHRGLTGLTRRPVQVSAWAIPTDGRAARTAVATIDAAVVQALGGFRGVVAGVGLQAVIADRGEIIDSDPEIGLWHAARTFTVIAREGA